MNKSVENFINRYNLDYKCSGGEFIIKQCPFCHPDTSKVDNQNKLQINDETGMYHCYRCGASGLVNNIRNDYSDKTKISFINPQSSTVQKYDWRKLWDDAIPLSSVEAKPANEYFFKRGFTEGINSEKIRFHKALFCNSSKNSGNHPGILFSIEDDYGKQIGLQRIYITESGNKADVDNSKMTIGEMSCGAIKFEEPEEILNVAEGPETSISIWLNTKIPTWSVVSASNMSKLIVPESVHKIHIWADKDKSETGENASQNLASKLFSAGKSVYIHLPPGDIAENKKSIDWLDIYNENPNLIMTSYNNEKLWYPAIVTKFSSSDFQEKLLPQAYYGIVGEIVKIIEPHTEADPAALLVQLLVILGNYLGRNKYYMIEATKHYPNLFAVIVGESSKARKGTSLDHILSVMDMVDPQYRLSNLKSGVVSGEGIIHSVRNPLMEERPKKDKETKEVISTEEVFIDAGVIDKRLLVIESEYGSVLKISAREGNTMSTVLRDAWDKGNLSTMSKNSPEKATGAHISLIGHITVSELRRLLSENDAHNGFGNRFIWVYARRSKFLPFGGNLDKVVFTLIGRRLKRLVDNANNYERIGIAEEIESLWKFEYMNLSTPRPGLWGALTNRAEAQVMRLALLYAILDESNQIREPHLKAALAVWNYSSQSSRYIFGNRLEDSVADDILEQLKETPQGLTRTEIRDYFSRRKSADRLEEALRILVKYGLAFCITESTGGRPCERWFYSKKNFVFSNY